MRKPTWIRSHCAKPRRRRDIPDYARFPDLPAVGLEMEHQELNNLRACRDRLLITKGR